MKFCLKDIAHDTQIEGTKGYYLYTAIKAVGNREAYLNKIIEKFGKRLYWRLSQQLFDILCYFSDDGYKAAGEALESKYKWLKDHLPVMKDYNPGYCEREQFEYLMIRKLDDGVEGFKQCVNDMGEMILKRGNDDCLFYDWFLSEAENEIGKDIFTFVENAENENATAFYHSYKLNKKPEYGKNTRAGTVTIEQLVNHANELAADDNPYRIYSLSRKFAKHANIKELKMLAQTALQEPSEFIKTSLLSTFRFADFPLDIGLLLPYMHSGSEYLREITIKILSRIKDKRIHALVPQLFKSKDIEGALSLLESNFEIEDEALIRKYIICSKKVTYEMVMSVITIYKRNKSASCGDILLHFYRNAACAHCRCDVVETMISNDVIPQNILEECTYDSYKETRELVAALKIPTN